MRFLVDLHNHSCLSPCASLEMSPSRVANAASARNIAVLGLSDHNSALNCPAFAVACGRAGIAPLFGLELNSIEEAHLLCFFPSPEEAMDFGASLYGDLPDLAWSTEALGDQVVVDADENVLELPERWLGAALGLSFDVLARRGADRGALVIPAHVDRLRFSVGSQLGFLPEGPYDAVESIYDPPLSLTGGLPAISGSDAHAPEQVGRRPFSVELPEGLVAAAVAAAAGYAKDYAAAETAAGGAVAATAAEETGTAGAEAVARPAYPSCASRQLLEALRKALASGGIEAVRPPAPIPPSASRIPPVFRA